MPGLYLPSPALTVNFDEHSVINRLRVEGCAHGDQIRRVPVRAELTRVASRFCKLSISA